MISIGNKSVIENNAQNDPSDKRPNMERRSVRRHSRFYFRENKTSK